MENIRKAISLAFKGEWNPKKYNHRKLMHMTRKTWSNSVAASLSLGEIMMDPLFWQALGKAEGWKKEIRLGKCNHPDCDGSGCDMPGTGDWKYQWHKFIDHLAENKDIDSFFNDLLK